MYSEKKDVEMESRAISQPQQGRIYHFFQRPGGWERWCQVRARQGVSLSCLIPPQKSYGWAHPAAPMLLCFSVPQGPLSFGCPLPVST